MVQNNSAVDLAIYASFASAGSFEAYESLDGDKAYRDEQKALFLSYKIENPRLDYPLITRENIESKANALKAIDTSDLPEVYREAYTVKIIEKLNELSLLDAVLDGDMNLFEAFNADVNGIPDTDIYFYTLSEIRKDAEANISVDGDIGIAAKKLLEILPQAGNHAFNISLPSKEVVAWTKEQFMKQFKSLFHGIIIDSKSKYNAPEIKEFFEKALNNVGASGEFKIEITESSKTAISVSQEKKTVNIPASREVTGEKLEKLIGHEIGTHVQRRENGEGSNLKLLGLGLSGYLQGEEGLTTVWEQSYDGKVKDFGRPEAYLSIGAALGLDGVERDFRQVFNILKTLYQYEATKKGKSLSESEEKANNDAWNRCIRTFRGTDCSAGNAFTKDICYRDGNIRIWQYMTKMYELGQDLPNLFIGKYDPTNMDHMKVINEITNIVPKAKYDFFADCDGEEEE